MATSVEKGLISVARPYDGSTDVYDFLEHFELAAVLLKWDEETQTVSMPAYLKGDAKLCYNELSDTEKKDIKVIKGKLMKECGKSPERYLQEFHVF
jgi:hypothetical protein